MTAPILVTGGTGVLGRLVVSRLRKEGREVRVLSRSRHTGADGIEFVRGDLGTDDGIDAAMAGIETIVHCAGSPQGDGDKARNLVRAAKRVGANHVVYISVVGADRIPIVSRLDRRLFGYFGAKRAAELIIADSGVPFTTLRATQFYDLVLTAMRQLSKSPIVPAPAGFRLQPIEADEVAARLVELALAPPAGLVPDMGGPRIYTMVDLIRRYLKTVGLRRPIMQVRMPGKAAGAFRAGVALAPERAVGRRTWEEFLAERVD